MYPYKRLHVWNRAHRLAVGTLREGALDAPGAAQDVGRQLRRATVSVSANIAEGAGSSSHAQFARYLGIGLASVQEAECLALAMRDADLLPAHVADPWLAELNEVRAMLIVLQRRVRHDPRGRSSGPG